MTVELWSVATAPVLTLNAADVRPAVTVTDAGTVKVAFVLVRVTTALPAGAAFVSVAVQLPDAFAPRLAGQASDDTSTGATRFTVALAELPLNVAVMVEL